MRYVPEFEKRWHRFSRSTGSSWRVDETYIAIKGIWRYLYRAVDKQGMTIDFLLREIAVSKQRRHFFGKRLLHILIDHRAK